MKEKGLKQRIQGAKTVEEVQALVLEGEGYKFALPDTIRAWKKAAAKRIASITGK